VTRSPDHPVQMLGHTAGLGRVTEMAEQRLIHSRVVVVALDGHSAAGKSTMAAELARTLDATIVHMDDFYGQDPEPERRLLTPAQGIDRYFDWERLRNEALAPLAQGLRPRVRAHDWHADGLGPASVLDAAPVVPIWWTSPSSCTPRKRSDSDEDNNATTGRRGSCVGTPPKCCTSARSVHRLPSTSWSVACPTSVSTLAGGGLRQPNWRAQRPPPGQPR